MVVSHWWAEGSAGSGPDEQTLESMPVGLVELDPDWNVRYINAIGEQMAGYTRAELVGRNYWAAFPANVDNEFGRAYRRAAETGDPTVVEAFYPEPLNQWFEVRAVPTRHGLWLYFTEVTDRRQAQERLSLLSRISDTLAGSIDAPRVVARVPRLIVPALASWASLTLLDDDGVLRPAGAHHVDPAQRKTLKAWAAADAKAMPATSPLHRAVHTGETITLDAAQLTGARLQQVSAGTAADLLQQLAPGTLTVLPLRGRDRVLGAITLGHGRTRTVDPLDAATAGEVAARTALALDNARLYRQQLQLATELQRHMLTPPPRPDHAEIAVRYLPASEAARVGGDWYDVFLQPAGAAVVVVGDVVGHDIAAAAVMGQLRAILRGLGAVADTPPAQLLSQLDAVLVQLQLHTYATVAVARFEQDDADIAAGVTHMRLSTAGHPAPVVIGPDGSLADPAGWHGELLIGVDPDAERTDTVVTLQRGSTVLFFTDGLLERRDRDLDAGLTALRDALTGAGDLPLEDLCDHVLQQLVEHPEDDVALVAVRLHRQDRPRPDEAGPTDVPPTVPEDPADT